jgi:hypothetical protein
VLRRRWVVERSKPDCCYKSGCSSSPVPSASALVLAA